MAVTKGRRVIEDHDVMAIIRQALDPYVDADQIISEREASMSLCCYSNYLNQSIYLAFYTAQWILS
jgi:hypothetical protein